MPEIPSRTTTGHTQDQETNAALSANDLQESSESSPVQVLSPSSLVPSVHTERSHENPSRGQSTSGVFELKMPENFFGQAKGETSSSNQVKPAPERRVDAQAESQPAVDHSPGSVIPARIHAEGPSQLDAVIIPKHRDKVSALQINESTQPGPIAQSQFTLATVASEVMDHVTPNKTQPTSLIAAQTLESSVPAPGVGQPSEYLQFRQPSIAPAPVTPPPRLQINRIDIQVVNQVPPPPPPPARAPDVSQVLEKHLGRVELLL
jgi:hypothetical protein